MRGSKRAQVTFGGVLALAVGGLLLGPGEASAASIPSQVVAAWSFDQVAGHQVDDVSGHGRTLALAGAWDASAGKAGTLAAAFEKQSYGSVSVPSPGNQDVAVTVVFRETNPLPLTDSPNLVQLGLYGDPGQIKAQIADDGHGRAQCRFKGTAGKVLLTGPSIDVSNGAWHKVTCWRQGNKVGVTVDGSAVSKKLKIGSITVKRSSTVAGRGLAHQDASDQFVGKIDALIWAIGDGSRAASISYASSVVHHAA
jgi:Laminin G domain